MRLYLSSDRLGAHGGRLPALLGEGRRAVVISNALDHIGADARRDYAARVHDPHRDFAALAIASVDLDLRDYFGDREGLGARLAAADLVWAVGGNAFILMRAMAASGFASLIGPLLARDAIMYGGWSAGAVVAAPSLRGTELMDSPGEVPAGYDREPVWTGLGLIDRAIVPHYRSDHPEAAAAEDVARHYADQGVAFWRLRDGDVLIADRGVLALHERDRA
jgi:dipeptidase E